MQDPSHAHADFHRREDFHSRDVARGESAALVNSTVIAIVAAFVLMALVFAWSPWTDGNSVTPGQGGEDVQPSQQQQAPERLPQQSPR